MRYTLLYSYHPDQAGPTEGEVEDWLQFDEDVKAAGVHVYEAGFQPAANARTVSVRDGRPAIAEGSGADGGEVIAGFWVIDVADVDAAADWAQRIPTARYGKVEVRPVVEFE